MAGSLVASAIQWIGSLLAQEASMLFEVADQVRGLQEDLELMQQYLQDADAKQEIVEIRTLVKQIRKLAYDAEDVIDTYILEVEAKADVLGKKGRFLKFACFLRNVPQTYSVGKKIQLMQSSVKRITDSLIDSGVRRITMVGDDLRTSSMLERHSKQKPRSYPYDDDGEFIVGLEKDIKLLVEVLVGEGKTQVNFVSIVGMGGSGKTTLARKLYNHPYTKDCFDCCAWVYISQEWSTKHVLSEILRKVSSPVETPRLNAMLSSSVEELVDNLRNILEKKSYLVVLDDVWRKEALEEILPALPRLSNNKGSKIIITTRNQEVVQYQNLQRHIHVHKPMPLSMEESWELFCKIAFNYHTDCNNESYESLGKEMLKKCDGLPLAIVALAGILNSKRSIREWQQVSEAVRSRVMEGTCTHMYGKVGDMLALSYDDLPCDLKLCFLHLGVFPEDCQIPAGMLTRMWIAEGLVSTNGDISLEDIAMQRLEELSHRFMIQVVQTNYKGVIKEVHLHDLLRELCVRKAKELDFLQVSTPISNSAASDASAMVILSRRAALHSSTYIPTKASNLRSLILLSKSTVMHTAYVSKEKLDLGVLHHNFRLLRLLNLWGIRTPSGVLPTQIGSLIHLRYLGIRASNITELPKSIGNLRNLLTLDYRNIDSDDTVEVPNVLSKLLLLRHLFLPIECPWILPDLHLSALENLQILWGVKCVGGLWFSREIPKLSMDLKKLKVVVSTEMDLEAAFSCPSLMFDRLQTFHCEWKGSIGLRVNRDLSPNKHLHKLELIGKIRMEKLSLILPSNLLILELKDSVLTDEDPMVVAGVLVHLKFLRLSNSYVGTEFTCNLGSFPKLEELHLEHHQNLCMWRIEKGALLSLQKIEIINCRKLQHFPKGLVFVTTLQQLDFFGVPKEFSEQARVYGWSQERLRLPHNYEAIIEQSDTPFDTSSIHKLYEQLTVGIFLNNKKKKFWIVKQEDHQYNCFMMYVDDLSRTTKHDIDDLPDWNGDDGNWKWTEVEESRDGRLIKVANLVSEALVLDVEGKFDIGYLSPHVTYAFSFVIKLDTSVGFQETRISTALHLPDGSIQKQNHTFNNKRMNEWLEVSTGEFETPLSSTGEAAFYLCCQWRQYTKVGFSIKGVVIEPRL